MRVSKENGSIQHVIIPNAKEQLKLVPNAYIVVTTMNILRKSLYCRSSFQTLLLLCGSLLSTNLLKKSSQD